MVEQYTLEQAKEFFESKKWEKMSMKERATFQLYQKRLCMPFDIFHEAMEKTLDRPVFTHEFGLNYDGLIQELEGKIEKKSLNDIINMLDPSKTIVVVI